MQIFLLRIQQCLVVYWHRSIDWTRNLYYFLYRAGFYSWRNTTNGSWFVQALCYVLSERGREDDLLSLMTTVSRIVSIGFESNTPQDSNMHQRKQIPCVTSLLTRKIYFKRKTTRRIWEKNRRFFALLRTWLIASSAYAYWTWTVPVNRTFSFLNKSFDNFIPLLRSTGCINVFWDYTQASHFNVCPGYLRNQRGRHGVKQHLKNNSDYLESPSHEWKGIFCIAEVSYGGIPL